VLILTANCWLWHVQHNRMKRLGQDQGGYACGFWQLTMRSNMTRVSVCRCCNKSMASVSNRFKLRVWFGLMVTINSELLQWVLSHPKTNQHLIACLFYAGSTTKSIPPIKFWCCNTIRTPKLKVANILSILNWISSVCKTCQTNLWC